MQEIVQFIIFHPILSVGWMGLLIATLYTVFTEIFSKVEIITCSEVTRLINKEDAIVIDLRQRNDFQKGHITGSINLSSIDISTNNIGKLGKFTNQPIIIVDYNGMKVNEAARSLKKEGFSKIYILEEGISGWKRKNLPLVNGVFKEINNG